MALLPGETRNIFTDSPVSTTVNYPHWDDVPGIGMVLGGSPTIIFGRVQAVDYESGVATVYWETGEVRVHQLKDLTSEEPPSPR